MQALTGEELQCFRPNGTAAKVQKTGADHPAIIVATASFPTSFPLPTGTR
jgi:hypothetical protein